MFHASLDEISPRLLYTPKYKGVLYYTTLVDDIHKMRVTKHKLSATKDGSHLAPNPKMAHKSYRKGETKMRNVPWPLNISHSLEIHSVLFESALLTIVDTQRVSHPSAKCKSYLITIA